jgi:GrpB-like predicted nucleotidyltransferase (UPF0157 family)
MSTPHPSVEIVSYREEWPAAYREIAGRLRGVAGDTVIAIHHIGSTAVPGLAAKDVIDVQVTVARLSDLPSAKLQATGFTLSPRTTDHCPPGLSLPPEQLAKLLFRFGGRPANVHVREAGRFNQRYALLCRDYLRAHRLAADAYAAIKRQLAAHFPDDIDAYVDIKDPVFDLMMVGAEDWASATRWSPPPSD